MLSITNTAYPICNSYLYYNPTVMSDTLYLNIIVALLNIKLLVALDLGT